MKNLKIIALVALFSFISADTFAAGWFQQWRSERQQRQVGKKEMKQKRIGQPGSGPQTGAPIDGGLLTLLAAGGIAIYGVKKNKKKAIEE